MSVSKFSSICNTFATIFPDRPELSVCLGGFSGEDLAFLLYRKGKSLLGQYKSPVFCVYIVFTRSINIDQNHTQTGTDWKNRFSLNIDGFYQFEFGERRLAGDRSGSTDSSSSM